MLLRAEERDLRQPEIVAQMRHPWPFWVAVLNLQRTRYRATLELLGVGLRLASAVSQRFKQALNCPRPVAWSPLIQPLIPTPAHASMPSGHSCEAYLFARTVLALSQQATDSPLAAQLFRLAHRIADNREVAGLHYRMDTLAGRILGEALGEWFVASASNNGQWCARTLNTSELPRGAKADAPPANPKDGPLGTKPDETTWSQQGKPTPAQAAPLLAPLWAKARAEWDAEGFRT